MAGVFTGLIGRVASAHLGDEVAKCRDVANPAACAQQAEDLWYLRHEALVKRNKNGLDLVLRGGKTHRLKNDSDENKADNWVTYDFYAYLKEIDSFLIRENYYEGGAFSLIDRKYGGRMKIDELPLFSPKLDHFVTTSICDAYCPYRIQIWKHTADGWFEMVWSFRPYEYWAGAKTVWLNNQTIKVVKQVREEADDPRSRYVERTFFIKLDAVGWSISNSPTTTTKQ